LKSGIDYSIEIMAEKVLTENPFEEFSAEE